MTDAHLPERWLNDKRFRRRRLSDGAYRSYMNALTWSVANRTDGVIERGDVEDIPDFNPGDIPELVKGSLWQPQGTSWTILDFATTQTGKDLLEKYEREKAWDRARKARKAKEAAEARLAGLDDSTGNSTGTVPPDSPSTGQARPGPRAVDLCTECGERQAQGGVAWSPDLCAPCANAAKDPTMRNPQW